MTTRPGFAPQAEKLPLILAAVAVVAVVIPAGLLAGAFAAPVAGLPDVGPLVRWGLPMVRAIHDLAAASTVGLLVAATTSRPTVLAAARSWIARTIGKPQRTSGPTSGSPATGAANAPASRPAGMTTATTATAARIRGSFSTVS